MIRIVFTVLMIFFSNNLHAEVVKEITINGNVRVSSETVKVYGDIDINKDYSFFFSRVFERKIPWGRKVSDVSSIYWEYEEATSIEIAKNKSQFYDEMFSFMGDYDLIEKQSMAMREPGDDLEKYARECLWWGRRAEKFFNSTEI